MDGMKNNLTGPKRRTQQEAGRRQAGGTEEVQVQGPRAQASASFTAFRLEHLPANGVGRHMACLVRENGSSEIL